MKQKFTYLFLFIMLCHAQVLFAQVDGDYRSITSGNWATTTTWERFTGGSWVAAPAAPSATDETITIRNGHTVTVAAVAGADQLEIESGGILTNTAAFTLSDGTGTDLDIQAGGTVNIGAAFNVTGVIDNAGTINWSAGTIAFNTGTLNNNSAISITGNNDITSTGTNTINNNSGASLTKSTGTGTTNINTGVVNAGTINATTGILRFPGAAAITNTGTFNVASGATVNIVGPTVNLNAGTSLTGAGLFRIITSTNINLSLSVPSTLTYESGGTINNTVSGALTINGTLSWIANAIRIPLTIAAGGTMTVTGSAGVSRTYQTTLINNGTINWNLDADMVLSDITPSTITNNSTGTFVWNAAGNRQLRVATGTTTFTNAGVFSKLGTGTTLTIPSVAFTNNSGAILRGQGTITFSGTGTLTNNGTLAPGTNLNASIGSLTINPSAITATSTTSINTFNSLVAGTGGHDQLNLTGNTDLTGSTLTVTDHDLAPLGVYTIMTTSGTFSNTFGTVNKPATFGNPVIGANTITIEKLSSAPLPLTWGPFTAKAVEQRALLTWKTLQEVNTSHFVIERSSDGVTYKAIGTVPAQGNSTTTNTYTFTDPSPIQKTFNFYRLMQVDLDGKSERSIVRTLKLDRTQLPTLIIQGNPVKNNVLKLNVTADEAISIAISDMNGKVVNTKLLQPGIHAIPISNLNAGTYQITVMENGKISDIKRFVKL